MKSLKFYGAVGGGIALLGCWPLAVGQIAHTAFDDLVTSIDNSNVSIELIDYQRGYLSSEATTKVVVEAELAKQQLQDLGLPTEFLLTHDIVHGLISVTSDSTIQNWDSDALVIESKTLLNGATDIHLAYSNAFSVMLEDSAVLTIPSWQVKGSVEPNQTIQYEIASPSIRVQDDFGAELEFADIEVTADGVFDNQLWLGNQKFTIGSVTFNEPESGFNAQVSGINYDFSTSFDDETNTYGTAYKLDVEQLKNIDIEANNIVVAMNAGGFDSNAVNRLAELSSGNALTDQQTAEMFDTLVLLLANGLSLEQEQLSFELGGGSVSSTWQLNWPEQASSTDIYEMLIAVDGGFSAYVTKPLVESFPMLEQVIDELMIMEIMTDDGQGYQLQGVIKDGNVMFENGQQIPLLMLAMAVLSNA
ncbi:DUF945 family protein [Vibrio ulleungensis]|uniref:DUF945 family protein n=1 Tax=Vibrio ulleungensis TaxID=2807619 RepID=A0ABS2HN14_9VIBR|nr:DUF945 family protein [Vibrio ulleungensis]MBM7038424.1 DUF945 family protein [Vibrio ulleungensis]